MNIAIKRPRGFTLVELIVVMVIIGVLAGSIAVFFAPAIQNYMSVTRRANMTDMADGAVRTMTRDIRSAVANSIRTPNTACFELVPTAAGGRYRAGADATWDAANSGNPSLWVNTVATTSGFDVMTQLTTTPKKDDYIVVNNQNTDDVYQGISRATIESVTTPDASLGYHRITLTAPFSIAAGYSDARFVTVPAAQKAVMYACTGTGTDTNGSGTGKLLRYSAYGFVNARANCDAPSSGTTAVLASKVESCTFIYDPNSGGTLSTGYMQMQITLREHKEAVQILVGTHADNTP